MAEVNFDNAVMTPLLNASNVSPMSGFVVSLANRYSTTNITNSSGTSIATNNNVWTKQTRKEYVERYSGTFSASGTEFYIQSDVGLCWRVSNVSFASGDTYTFDISISVV